MTDSGSFHHHSSDEDEFFDAEDTTPSKQHKKNNSQCQNEVEKDLQKMEMNKIESHLTNIQNNIITEPIKDSTDLTPEKNIIHGRRKFRELRQYMQTEDDDCGPSINSTPDSQTSSAEGIFPTATKTAHPFRIIEHDTMSLQSLTSLGRIGRILGGTEANTMSLGRDSHLSSGATTNIHNESRESAEMTSNDDHSLEMPLAMPMQEPDVIASTKANSLKHSRMSDPEQSIMTMSRVSSDTDSITQSSQWPVAPPRKKKKSKVSATLSLNSPSEEQPPPFKIEPEPKSSSIDKPTLQNLNIDLPSLRDILDSSAAPLPSPASTIESLTREFQHSLDMNNSTASDDKRRPAQVEYVSGMHDSASKLNKSESSSRSSTIKSVQSQNSGSSVKGNSLDIRSAIKGQYVVKPQDDSNAKAAGPSSEELERLEKFINATNKNGTSHMICPSNVGHSSLGSSHRFSRGQTESERGSKERRKSAGDENTSKQLNMFVRTRTDSGKQLTDIEILEQVTVLNLDTGERVPLSVAEDKLPQCINPLSLHIMRLTSEYVSTSSIFDDDKQRESDDDTVSVGIGSVVGNEIIGIGGNHGARTSEEPDEQAAGGLRRKTAKLKKLIGSTVKKTMDKAKSIAQEVSHARHREDVADIVDEVRGEQNIKLKASNSHKGPYDFDTIRHVQEFSDHIGAVWCMKFSQCGRLLATAGQDKILRIWVIKDAFAFFQDMRKKYNAKRKSSPTPSQESLVSHHSLAASDETHGGTPQNDSACAPFMQRPFCTYTGHTSDLLDVSWSKNYFILSSSMDKTVRLWHICRKECLCCFQHIDFVTAIVFHPKDDRYFLSGSLDGKLRLWNIPDKKVAVWNEVEGQTKLITAANFCQNGKYAAVGTYDGRCILFTTDQLKYYTQIDVRSTRGKNSTGRKISGIEPMPGEDRILVTSNDSRIRLYDLRGLVLSCKYKGYVNVSSQIKASFSHDGKYIVSGSENQCIYIWKTHHDYSKFSSVRRDRNDFWEGIKAHNAVVTCAIFAPNPDNIVKTIDEREKAAKGQSVLDEEDKIEDPIVEQHTKGCGGHVLVSADFNGCIKVFLNKTKPKHSSLPASALA